MQIYYKKEEVDISGWLILYLSQTIEPFFYVTLVYVAQLNEQKLTKSASGSIEVQ